MGPERLRLDECVRRALSVLGDPREVISDPHAGYYGIPVSEGTLVPGNGARLGEERFEDWRAKATTQVGKAGAGASQLK